MDLALEGHWGPVVLLHLLIHGDAMIGDPGCVSKEKERPAPSPGFERQHLHSQFLEQKLSSSVF